MIVSLRSRSDRPLPEMTLRHTEQAFILSLPAAWLNKQPATEAALQEEVQYWRGIKVNLAINAI